MRDALEKGVIIYQEPGVCLNEIIKARGLRAPAMHVRPSEREGGGAEKAWLDVVVFRCPSCGHLYAEAAWYAVELGASIECGVCGAEFDPRETLIDRVMLEFKVEGGCVASVRIADEGRFDA